MLYIGGARPHQAFDERVFATLRVLRQQHPESRRITLQQFKRMIRDQYLLLYYDEQRAIAALPALLPSDLATRQTASAAIRKATEAPGRLTEASKARLSQIEVIFNDEQPQPEPAQAPRARSDAAE